MQITPDPYLQAKALSAIKIEYGMDQQRPGIHQSQLIYCLTKSYWGLTDPEPTTDNEALLWGIGYGLERVLLRPFEKQPEPLELDGIVVSLDSIHQFGGPADLKSTRMSSTGRKGEDGFMWPESWKRAFMAYRYVLNQLCECGHLHTKDIYGCTNYRRVQPEYDFGAVVIHLIKPDITAWRITYTHNELVENWAYLLTRRDQLESMLAGQNPMPFIHNEDWECSRCGALYKCQLTKSIEELSNA